MTNLVDNFNNFVKNSLSIFDRNKYIGTGVTLFLILYSAVAAPKLPPSVLKIFDNIFVKLLIFFLIAYIAQKDVTVAIVASIGLMVTLIILNKTEMNDMMMNTIRREEEMYTNVGMGNTNSCPYIFDPLEVDKIQTDDPIFLPEEALKALDKCGDDLSCYEKTDYRNNFYHQLVNEIPDHTRFNNNDENGQSFDCKKFDN